MNVNGIRVLGLSCQPHIDLVLISNDWRSKSHFEGATGKASGSLNWTIGELSFSRARDSAFFVFHTAMTKLYERRAYHSVCRIHISRTRNFPYTRSARPLHDQIHRELPSLMGAHDKPLSVAMRGLLALSAVVENGYDP